MSVTGGAGEVAMSLIYSCACADTKLAVQFDKLYQKCLCFASPAKATSVATGWEEVCQKS